MSSFPVSSRGGTTASSSSPSCSSSVPSTTLPIDPWLVNPFATSNTSFCTNTNGSNNPNCIPFFPTNCNVSTLYPSSSYPNPSLHHPYGSFSSSDTNELINETTNNADSIAHLRIKAKEYMSAIIGTTNNTKNHLVWPQGV